MCRCILVLLLWISSNVLYRVTLYRPAPIGEENHSIIDLTIDEIDVKLSMLWLLEGKGLVKEARIKGVRGTVDRRTERNDPNWRPRNRKWQRGDYELTDFTLEDLLITLQ